MPFRVALSGRAPKKDAIAVLVAAGVDWYRVAGTTPDELAAAVETADAMIVGPSERFDAAVLARSRACRVICRHGVGVDNVDIQAATRRGIAVTCVPDASVEEVSEHTLGLLLACARRIPQMDSAVRSGAWARAGMKALEPAQVGVRRLSSLTLGIIGFGRIGQAVWRKARPLGCHCLVYDPWIPAEVPADLGVQRIGDLLSCLERCDLLTLHMPLTAETVGLIGRREIAALKPNACLVNTARGQLVDEGAVAAALADGHLAAAALDVTEVEPIPVDSPLLGVPNLILTAHSAYYSAESMVDLGRRAAESVLDILHGRPSPGLLNPEYTRYQTGATEKEV